MESCPFCELPAESIALEGGSLVAIFDKFPVNEGHMLVISRRHVPTLFDLSSEEIRELHLMLSKAKHLLEDRCAPDGYNIGANCGTAAGQTVDHFHLHLIPRYSNDVANPRGGIRNIKKPLVPY